MSRTLDELLALVCVEEMRRSILMTDPLLPDNPIVYVSDDFCLQTGYERAEVIGRNCRFLQGPGTDRQSVAKIRHAIASITPIEVTVLNYRADRLPFWNRLSIRPLFDDKGNLQNFVGVQRVVAPPVL